MHKIRHTILRNYIDNSMLYIFRVCRIMNNCISCSVISINDNDKLKKKLHRDINYKDLRNI